MRGALERTRWTTTVFLGALLLLVACNDGQAVDDDRCSAIGGDPYVPTSCLVVRGTVRNPSGDAVRSAHVVVDALRPETPHVETATGKTGDDGTYRIKVLSLRDKAGPGRIVVRIWDSVSDRRATSDTVSVTFQSTGELPNVYDVDVQLAASSSD